MDASILLPLEKFAKLPFIERASLSPDGTRVAGLLVVNGQQMIKISSLFNASEPSFAAAIPDGTQVYAVRWVNDDNLLVNVTALLPVEGDRWYVSRLFGINRKTSKITKLMWDQGGQNAANVLQLPADGSSKILAAAQGTIYTNYDNFWPTVYSVDVESGRYGTAVKGRQGVLDWYSDGAGRVRAGVYYGTGGVVSRLLYRGENESLFRTVDRASGIKGESVIDPVQFLPGTDHAIALHDDEKGRASLYEIDLKTLEDVKVVYQAPPGAEITRTWVSRDGREMLGTFTSSREEPVHWFDPVLAEMQGALDKAVAGARAEILSMSGDRSRFLVSLTRPESPGGLYYFDANVGQLQRIGLFNEALGSRPLSRSR